MPHCSSPPPALPAARRPEPEARCAWLYFLAGGGRRATGNRGAHRHYVGPEAGYWVFINPQPRCWVLINGRWQMAGRASCVFGLGSKKLTKPQDFTGLNRRSICFDKSLYTPEVYLLLVRWVRLLLLLLLPPLLVTLRAWPIMARTAPHRCQVRQGKGARKGADRDRASPSPGACLSPVLLPVTSQVACAAARCFNGLWGRGGLPLTGRRRVRAFALRSAAAWRALCPP
jgi:hypothetical protein